MKFNSKTSKPNRREYSPIPPARWLREPSPGFHFRMALRRAASST